MEKLKKVLGLAAFGIVLIFMGSVSEDFFTYLKPNEVSIAGTVGHVGLILIGAYLLGWFAWGTVINHLGDKKEKQE